MTAIRCSAPPDRATPPQRATDAAEEAESSQGWLIGGRYRVAALLGRGGMADVFRAHDEVLHRRVAVKVFAAEPEVQGRADREIRTAAALHHPNLVTVFDAGVDTTDQTRPVSSLVMELIHGPTVAERIAADPLDPVEVAELGAQVAAALHHIHGLGIVHRDVKPANVLLALDQG